MKLCSELLRKQKEERTEPDKVPFFFIHLPSFASIEVVLSNT